MAIYSYGLPVYQRVSNLVVPGLPIMTKGQIGNTMFIILKGSVDIFIDDSPNAVLSI